VRNWIQSAAKIRAIISLPIATFSPFGANIKTNILILRKWRSGERSSAEYNVFMGRVDSVGYDAAGRQSGISELDETRNNLKTFLEKEGW
jgi:type I restriction enzyme M protein